MAMPIVIAKNQTVSDIYLERLGLTVPGSGQLTLTDFCSFYEIASDETLSANVDTGDIIINDGTSDLSIDVAGVYIDATGNLNGPTASIIDNALLRIDGTTGRYTQSSIVTLSDTGTFTSSGALNLAGTTGDFQFSGAVTIDSSGGTISIGSDADAQAINVGTGAAARTITIGNATGATSLVLNAGTGAVNLGSNAIQHNTTLGSTTGTSALTHQTGTGAMTFTAGGIFDVNATGAVTVDGTGISIDGTAASNLSVTGNSLTLSTITSGALSVTSAAALNLSSTTGDWQASGNLTLDSSGGTIGIGTDADANNINIGTGAAARLITIGNATGATSLVLNAGTGTVTIASNATQHNTTIGSTTGTSALTSQTGTGTMTFTAGGAYDVNAVGAVTINSSAADVSISNDSVAQTVNIGTGAAAKTINVGNTASTTAVNINAGTGAMTFTAGGIFDVNATGAVTIDSSGSTIGIGTSAVAQAINIGTGAAARAITIGNSVSTTSIDLNAGTGAVNIGSNGIAHATTVGSTTGASATTIQSGTGNVTITAPTSTLSGNLVVSGTTTNISSDNVSISDNHLYLNAGYNTVAAQTGGLVVNYLPTSTTTTVNGNFTAGVVSTSNPTVITTGSATFSASDIIQISGATEPGNNGLFEVLTHVGTTLTIRGIGLTATVEDFTQNQFTASTSASGTIRKVTVSILRSGTDGIWESAAGSATGLTFANITGDVVGPASSVDNTVVRFDGTTGKLIQDGSTWTIADTTGTASISGSVPMIAATATNATLTLRGNKNAGQTSEDVEIQSTLARTGGRILSVSNQTTVQAGISFDGCVLPQLAARSSGIAQALRTGGISHTSQTASTEASQLHLATYTRQWATGAITTQREVRLEAPTYGFVGSSTITDAANLYVGGAPIAGTNATITNAYALWVDDGLTRLDGTLQVADLQATAALTIDSTSTIGIGTDADAQAINIGTGAAARTITIGNGTGATSLVLNAGTGAVNLGSNATDHTTTVGSTSGTSASTLQSGTGAMTFTAGGIFDVNATGAVTVDGTGISIDGTAASNLSVTGNSLTLSTITSGTLAVTSAAALNLSSTTGDWQASGVLTIDSSGGAISIGSDADAQAINVGTGAAARTITIGNVTGATALVMNAGTGSSSLTTTGAGTFSLVAGTGTIELANNATDHSTILGSITGTSATTIRSGTGNLTLTSPDVLVGTLITVPNTGLHLLDTNASHDLIIAPGSDLSADRTLTLTTGDASRTLNFTGAQGSIYYTDASGNLVSLAPGTSGQYLKTLGAAADPAWDTVSGSGDVVGPASATDNALVRFDTTTGKLIQDSSFTLGDTGVLTMNGSSINTLIVGTANGPLYIYGNRNAGQSSAGIVLDSTVARTNGSIVAIDNDGSDVAQIRFDGAIVASVTNRTSGSAGAFRTNAANHSSQTASTEVANWHNQAYTRQWLSGALTTQREIQFDAPTYSFAGSSTITDAANLYIGGAPIAGTNATITNSYALWVDSGISKFDDSLILQSYSDIQQIAVPSNPSAGTRRLFVNSATGELSVRTSGGTTVSLEGGGSSTTYMQVPLTIDSGDSYVSTGFKGFFPPFLFAATIVGWRISCDQAAGSVEFDVWKSNGTSPTNSDTITASAKPTLTSAQTASSSTLTGWTTAISSGDILGFEVESISGSISRVTLILDITVP